MALLVGVRGLTGGYIEQAERIGWAWLGQDGSGGATDGKGEKDKLGDEVLVVVSEWGDKTIGALVLRIVKRERTAYVRAWTTRLRYRKKGIGRGLLEEGVRIVVEEKGCKNVVFDDDHASRYSPRFPQLTKISPESDSKRVLPAIFNRGFDRREGLARKMLADVVAEQKKKK